MSNTTGNQTHASLYGNANLFYIRAPELVETRTNGQKKIKANPYPSNRALITEQPKYHANSWNYYALLMGREFRPGRFVVLLDFDNKDEGGVNGMKLIEKLNMNQYGAPGQKTPLRWKTLFVLRGCQAEGKHHSKNNNSPRRC